MYEGFLPDRRLVRRADRLQEALGTEQGVSVAALSRTRAEQIANYRLLRNARVQEGALIEAQAARAGQAVATLEGPRHVLAPQDTTQMNLEAHRGRVEPESGLGVIGDDRSLGFFVHPTLLIEASQGHALGFSDVVLWSRDPERPRKEERDYKQLPLEEKESRRWVESLVRTRQRLEQAQSSAEESAAQGAVQITGIADREGDLYPLFARLPDEETHLLVRACRDRRIEESPEGLFAYLSVQPVVGSEEIELRGDVRKRRSARRALLEYRIAAVQLRRPRTWPEESEEVGTLWAIEVREVAETVPEGEEGIHWRLLTTHRVESFAQARQVVDWYRQRWHLEQIFRLLKLDGLDLESSQLESGYALRRLAVMALGAALDVLRLLLAERGESQQPLGQVFSEAEQACLQAVAPEVEGRTRLQQNPHPPQTLGWAAWIIARLGGWKGYRSQRPAGPITYRRGLTKFALLCHGYHLHTNDVCTP